VNSVADKIRSFETAAGDWRPLDSLLTQCFTAPVGTQEIDAVFMLFERYPEEDGAGVFWSAIHGLEAVGGYEDRLKSSLARAPSSSAVALAIRIINAGDTSFLPIISEVAAREGTPMSVRSLAMRYLAKKKGQPAGTDNDRAAPGRV
jgi:hypothetical protein